MKREIVTVQVGTSSNYVGSHFWNLQLEYLTTAVNNRELSVQTFLRENGNISNSTTSDKTRYVPRVQIIDTKNAFGALSTDTGSIITDVAQDTEVETKTWDKNLQQVYFRERIPRSTLLKSVEAESITSQEASQNDNNERSTFTDTTATPEPRYWSDFLDTQLHPRTCHPTSTIYSNEDSNIYYAAGRDIATNMFCDDLYEDLRYFIEECDSLGGINIIADADNMFSGVTASYLAHLDEELGFSVPKLIFGIHSPMRMCIKETAIRTGYPYNEANELIQSQNEAQLVAECLDRSAEYIPLSSILLNESESLKIPLESRFHTAAALSTAMNVTLTPIQQDFSLSGLLGSIQPSPIALYGNLVSKFPVPPSFIIESDSILDIPGAVNLSQLWKIRSHYTSTAELKKKSSPLYTTTELVSARGIIHSPSHYRLVTQPVTTPSVFPYIFRNDETNDSFTRRGNYFSEKKTISVIAGLCTVKEDGALALRALGDTLGKGKLFSSQISSDDASERTEVSESLLSRAEDYEDF